MKNLNLHRISSFLIYLLTLILIFLISYSLYASYNKKNPKVPPRNSINVSPFTGQRIQPIASLNSFDYVSYNINNLTDLHFIEDADIVYEWFNPNLNKKEYSAIFYNKKINPTTSIETVGNINVTSMPKFNFVDNLDIAKYDFSSPCDVIFVGFNKWLSSSFIYKDGTYYHYSSNSKDTNTISNKDLCYTNVIIQFIDNYNDISQIPFLATGTGKGLLFTAGGYKEICWKGSEIFLKDSDTALTLQKGNTFWIFSDKNSNITLNKSK